MHTPKSTSSDRPPKRLRLGTKSCVECRRRKVRCIFEQNSKTCKECSAHETECISQKSTQGPRQSLGGDSHDVQQKLQSLEEMLHRVCEAMNLGMEPSVWSPFEMRALESLTEFQTITPSPESSQRDTASIIGAGCRDDSESRSSPSASEKIESFEDAPLLNLFQEAMLIQKQHDEVDRNRLHVSSSHQTKSHMQAIKALIPNSSDLDLILRATERFWPVWLNGQDLVIASERHHFSGIPAAKRFILNSIESDAPLVVAKAILFLALCVQQLPIKFKNRMNLPAPSKVLVDSYIKAVDNLLSIKDNRSPTIEGLECLTIQGKLYINMGKPREAWHNHRHALNQALLLGLHNLDETAPDRQKAIWSHIWQGDRQYSSMLGLPAATTDSHPGVGLPNLGGEIMYDFAVIAGHINERNQNYKTVNYSVTLKIDQELQDCKNRISPEWWDSITGPDTPLEDIYSRQVTKIFFYMSIKLLHLPYMLKSSVDKTYEYSRMAALNASRDLIRSYLGIRHNPELALTICELMDFQAFTGAVVLAIDLLSQPCQIEGFQEVNDWDLIHDITRSLRLVSEAMECNIARQSAQLLEHLSTFRQDTYSGPETYEVVVPLFGKVRIHKPKRQHLPSSLYDQNGFEQQNMDTIQFNTNSFAPYDMVSTGDFLSDAELDFDWTAFQDLDYNFDWSQTIDGSMFR
ncbi:hypothetical protein B7494_g4581 [Chlorociboria aeruginascens]|nr:hypothetical protein B7494_g4581 [Chlorociboria aeruginascens]